MENRNLNTFKSIKSFIQDLDNSFGKRNKPIALYNRLISKTNENDTDSINRHISAFEKFYKKNSKYISSNVLESKSKITFSDRIFLDLDYIFSKTSKSEHKHIHHHLLTIYSIMNSDNDKGQQVLEKLKNEQKENDIGIDLPDTKEGEFIKRTLTELTDQFEDIDENANPMMMMSNMMQSGFFQKFMGDLQSNFSSGDMDIKSLMSTVTNVISSASPEGTEEASQIKDFVSQSMSQVSAMTGADMPTDVQDQMSGLLNAMTGCKVEEAEQDL